MSTDSTPGGNADPTKVGFRTPSGGSQPLPGEKSSDSSATEQAAIAPNAAIKPPSRTLAVDGPPTLGPFLTAPVEPGEIGRLGSYRVLRILGSGGMGVVYHAQDEVLRRSVALKVMRPDWIDPEAGWHRLLREARAMASIKHENLITLYQAGQEGDVFYLAMELLEGESLEERTKHPPRLNVEEILRIGREVAGGLGAIHSHNLIHRDIKPSNIWLEKPDGRARILDFGLVRFMNNTNNSTNLTQEGTVVGTPAFMSPEQARGVTVDPRSDLFSLGCVLYDLCTGVRPFQGDTLMAQLTALAVDNPRPIHELNPQIPESLSNLVTDLLSKRPEDRPDSAETVVQRIKRIEYGATEGKTIVRAPASAIPLKSVSIENRYVSVKPASSSHGWQIAVIAGLACVFLAVVVSKWPGDKQTGASASNSPPLPNPAPAVMNTGEKAPNLEKKPPPPDGERPRPSRGGPLDDNDGPPGRDGPPDRIGPPDGPDDQLPGAGRRRPRFVVQKYERAMALLKAHLEKAAAGATTFLTQTKVIELESVYFPKGSGQTSKVPYRGPPDAFVEFGVQGQPTPHAIGMHPSPDGPAYLSMDLGGQYKTFNFVVSQNDGMEPAASSMQFRILGDGNKVLWQSGPVSSQRDTQAGSVSVENVKVLRLELDCDGEPRACHAIWFEPFLQK